MLLGYLMHVIATMTKTIKIRLRVDSDPYRLIHSIQGLSPEDVDKYLEDQAEKIAYNDAVKEVQRYPTVIASHERAFRVQRVKSSAKERYPGRLKQLSKYKIKIIRTEQLDDEIVEITGERI